MNLNSEIFPGGLAYHALQNGGCLRPIEFDIDYSKISTLMNPSIYNDGGVIRACVRGTNYTMHHSEYGKYPHWAGPLQYIHPENDVRLATENYVVDFDEDLNVTKVRYVDMRLNVTPIWEFQGLEDARLVRWNGDLYLSGVRRDTTTTGQGRMELTKIELTDDSAIELSRVRIPTFTDIEYCEKNWLPIIDKPFHYLRFTHPTEIVKFNLDTQKLEHTEFESKAFNVEDVVGGFRGSTHVIPVKDYYLSMCHSVKLWKPLSGEKDAEYWNYFTVFDKNLSPIKMSPAFKFINSAIEFSCGMCLDNNGDLLISFAECDNVPFILKLKTDWLLNSILN